ncbi:2'-5' RNA ligase family protein [Angustibacter luteus]
MALTPDDEALDELAEFLAPRLAADPTLRFVDRAQWHVTLAFLPDVPARCLDDLQDRLARAALRRNDFALAIAGGGAFPDVAAARVLYGSLDVPDGEELSRLATGTRAAASRAGAAPDGGRFRPHLTLARSRVSQDLTRWVRVLETFQGAVWWAQRIELVESRLGEGPGGRPVHEVVAGFPLGGP